MTTAENAPATITPAQLIARHSDDLSSVLPSHIKAPVWIRVAQAAVRRDEKLAEAAAVSPKTLMVALLNAARLGLEPGTEEFYLTPRKVKGRPEVLGIVGYQGIIEMIYRAGAVSSVIAECVYANDGFDYKPGRDDLPRHTIDWDSTDRGPLRLVYAYARLRSGAVSKVVVMNRAQVMAVKAKSQGANSEFSPWQTNEAAMWLKSSVRQLKKWVPTSAEYRDQLRADAVAVAKAKPTLPVYGNPDRPFIDAASAYSEDDVIDDESMAALETEAVEA